MWGRTNRLLSFHMTRTTDETTCPTFFLLLRVFLDARTRLPSRCLVISEIYIQTHRLTGGISEVRRSDGLRCYDIHDNFHKDWSRHSEVDKGRQTHRQRQQDDSIAALNFFRVRKLG
jgi:hypothetical protein